MLIAFDPAKIDAINAIDEAITVATLAPSLPCIRAK